MRASRLESIAADVVAAVQRRLPDQIRDAARAVPVHCAARPDASVTGQGFPDDLLGLFTGASMDEEPGATCPVPPQIFLYLDNLWDYSGEDVRAFREEVRLTYLHELGHYLGWDEDDLAARGLD